ncbi:hypothetical protein [Nocardioides sp.]|uniref:hypothetical protein n=1 Tax=Nocardioides sp. TaxID=35761 RepID=UPI002D0BE993|nr:hypothetical protein [Nocardioides sp.]HXH79551.1 hypothetical protein [Nocardioides sp.]
MITELQSVELCAVLSDTYPNAKLGARSPEMYRALIGDVPWEVVLAALPTILRRHPDFCPSAPALANAIQDLTEGGAPDWETAWEAVKAQRRDNHLWRPWSMTDPLAFRAARIIGIEAICMVESDQENTMRAQYRDVYRGLAASGRRDDDRDAVTGGTAQRIAELAGGLKRMPSAGNVVPMVKVGTGR